MKRIQEIKKILQRQIDNCSHGQEIGSRCFCRSMMCPERNCKATNLKMTSIASHYYKKHPDLTPKRLKAFPLQAFTCDSCQKDFEDANPYSWASSSKELSIYETFCGGCEREMEKARKISLSKKNMSKIKKTRKIKSNSKSLVKPCPTHPKENKVRKNLVSAKQKTLSYYECLLQQIANTEGIKITKLCNWCRGNKDKVAWSKEESKRELVDKVAQSYLEFGKGLGHLLSANIVEKNCKCK